MKSLSKKSDRTQTVGLFLKKARTEKQMTLVEASQKLGFTPQFLSHIENNRCSLPFCYWKKVIALYLLNKNELLEILLTSERKKIQKFIE